MIILSTLIESTNLDESIQWTSRWFIVAKRTQNLEIVNLKCVSYTYIWVPLICGVWVGYFSKEELQKIWFMGFKILLESYFISVEAFTMFMGRLPV